MPEGLLRHRIQLCRTSSSFFFSFLLLSSTIIAQQILPIASFSSSSSSSTTTTTTLTSTPSFSSIQSSTPPSSTSQKPYASSIPNIDVCGHAQGGVSCPGAGQNSYFYRCCSSEGHCGPKNNIQDQNIYCGTGCQKGYGKCDSEAKPPVPTAKPGIAQNGQTCGPIVNRKCASGLCCSGSNFCGTGTDFCGSANWCQAKWGQCS